ncbi:MAG: hypothetical protein N2558_03880 [Patescibacteria group bacterium]|nr:hypothetical protein [Patescibacteria group bacterium]
MSLKNVAGWYRSKKIKKLEDSVKLIFFEASLNIDFIELKFENEARNTTPKHYIEQTTHVVPAFLESFTPSVPSDFDLRSWISRSHNVRGQLIIVNCQDMVANRQNGKPKNTTNLPNHIEIHTISGENLVSHVNKINEEIGKLY